MRILVINCGSTTLKHKLYESKERGLTLLAAAVVPLKPGDEAPIADLLATLPAPPDAVAHRVVHGGDRYTTAVLVDGASFVTCTSSHLWPLCITAPRFEPSRSPGR